MCWLESLNLRRIITWHHALASKGSPGKEEGAKWGEEEEDHPLAALAARHQSSGCSASSRVFLENRRRTQQITPCPLDTGQRESTYLHTDSQRLGELGCSSSLYNQHTVHNCTSHILTPINFYQPSETIVRACYFLSYIPWCHIYVISMSTKVVKITFLSFFCHFISPVEQYLFVVLVRVKGKPLSRSKPFHLRRSCSGSSADTKLNVM